MELNLSHFSKASFRNYVSRQKAIEIAEKLDPMPIWNYRDWCFLLEDMGIVTEDAHYNEFALYVAMVCIVSKHGQIIAKKIGMPFSKIPHRALLLIAYYIAKQKLTEDIQLSSI